MQILAGIILLGVLIAFHELGHFLFAKWLGVRVLVFSIGFGPKIWGFKRGETEYRLSAIPLGGYVRMFGESLEEELTPEEKKMSFMHQPIWRKSLIAFAGPLFNFILPVILFFFLLIGTEQVFAPRVGTLFSGGVAEKAGILEDDLIIAVDNQPVSSFNEVAEKVASHPNVDVELRIERRLADGSLEKFPITVRPEAKPGNNPLEKNEQVGRIGIMPSVELPKVFVLNNSPLKASGLMTFDEIIKIDDMPIKNANAMVKTLADLQPGSTLVVKRPQEGQETTELSLVVPSSLDMDKSLKSIKTVHNLTDQNELLPLAHSIEKTREIITAEEGLLVRQWGIGKGNGSIKVLEESSIAEQLGFSVGDRLVSIDGEKLLSSAQLEQSLMHDPQAPHVIGLIKQDATALIAIFVLNKTALEQVNLDQNLTKMFGITTIEAFSAGEILERNVGVFEAVRRSFTQTVDIAWMTGKSLWLLLKMEVPTSQIGGPIMLFDVAQQAAQKGLPYYIFIMCLLSVNLGLLNLLPIPALDGGHLLLFGIEAVQRKPLTAKTRAIATQVGVAILLLIMAFALWNDFRRLLG